MTLSQPKIRTGDTVRILHGRDRGKTGKVLAVLPREDKVIVDGINTVKKHVRAQKQGSKGQRVSISAPLNLSNTQLVCPKCKKGTRVAITRENNKRERVCKKCNESID